MRPKLPTLWLMAFLLSSGTFAGQLDLGVQYQNWSSNLSQPLNGQMVLVPLTLSLDPIQDLRFYAQGEFAHSQTTDPIDGVQNLSAVSDTVVGGEIGFKSFSFPSFLNIGVNLPTGNQAWQTQTGVADIPTEFVDSPYQGRGLGLSSLYGIALPAGNTQYGLGAGYYYTGALNPNANSSENLKLGDSIFISANQVTSFSSRQTQTIAASAYYFLPTLEQSQNFLWMGPNFNLSYTWSNPSALSFEAGVQYFLPAQTAVNGQWVAETHNSLGARIYLDPSWAFGDLVLAGRVKYVLANGYGTGDASYDGGGLVLGFEPSYKVEMDNRSAVRFSASYDNITHINAGLDPNLNLVNILYNRFAVGAGYEIKL